ncbi:MAG: hypothetical protein QOF49_239 [Chloroflexota bacterium]|nr:hypothetical protein [Chloroflexota bacterium]
MDEIRVGEARCLGRIGGARPIHDPGDADRDSSAEGIGSPGERVVPGHGGAIREAARGRRRQDHDADRRDRGVRRPRRDVAADIVPGVVGVCRGARFGSSTDGCRGRREEQRVEERLVSRDVFAAAMQADRSAHRHAAVRRPAAEAGADAVAI